MRGSQVILFSTTVAAVLAFQLPTARASEDPEIKGGADGGTVWVEASKSSQANETLSTPDPDQQPAQPVSADGPPTEYRYTSVCSTFSADGGSGTTSAVGCPASQQCTGQDQRLFRLWSRTPPAGWIFDGTFCVAPETATQPAPAAPAARPQVTEAVVLNALRRIGLPTLEARTQPADKTLVNFDTIFYTDPEPFVRSVTLLGQTVEIEATPQEYTWHHGDGTSAATATPGAPYPSMEITYSYTDAHVTVSPSVDVTYAARFRVNRGNWQDISETVTIVGPPTDLRISEATPVLSGDYE